MKKGKNNTRRKHKILKEIRAKLDSGKTCSGIQTIYDDFVEEMRRILTQRLGEARSLEKQKEI